MENVRHSYNNGYRNTRSHRAARTVRKTAGMLMYAKHINISDYICWLHMIYNAMDNHNEIGDICMDFCRNGPLLEFELLAIFLIDLFLSQGNN